MKRIAHFLVGLSFFVSFSAYSIVPQVIKAPPLNNIAQDKNQISLQNQLSWGDRPLQFTISPKSSKSFNGAVSSLLKLEGTDDQQKVYFWGSQPNVFLLDSQMIQSPINEQAANLLIKLRALLPHLQKMDLRFNSRIGLFDSQMKVFRFDRYVRGQLVDEAHLTVRLKQGQLIHIDDFLFATAKVLSQVTSVEQSKEVVLRDADLQRNDTLTEKYEQVYRVSTGAMGKVLLIPTIRRRVQKVEPLGNFVYEVDASQGRISRLYNMILGSQLKASIYNRHLKSETSIVGLPFHKIAFDALCTVFTDIFGKFEPQNSQATRANVFMESKYTRVYSKTGKTALLGLDTKSQEIFTFDNSNSSMSERMATYYVNLIRVWAKQYSKARWLDGQLAVNVNIDNYCNAFWNGRSINFFNAGYMDGSYCRNTGEISDVIFHEWGHGFHENTSGIKDVAYSEGIGDIMSLLQTDSPLIAPEFNSDGSPIRNLSDLFIFPRDRGEPHREGLILGGSFWDLYQTMKVMAGAKLAKDILARWFIKTVESTTKYTDVYRNFIAIDIVESSILLGKQVERGIFYCAINQAFVNHNLTFPDTACVNPIKLGPILLQKIRGGSGTVPDDVFMPGENILATVEVTNPTAEAEKNVSLNWFSNSSILSSNNSRIMLPNLAANSTQRVSIPVQISEAAKCGQSFDFKLTLMTVNKSIITNVYSNRIGVLPTPLVATWEPKLTIPADGIAIPDADANGLSIAFEVPETVDQQVITAVAAFVDIEHQWIGDLKIDLIHPSGTVAVLRSHKGGAQKEIKEYIPTNELTGLSPQGAWNLKIVDIQQKDVGKLNGAKLKLTLQQMVRCN